MKTILKALQEMWNDFDKSLKISFVIFILSCIVFGCIDLYLRFTNIDVTQTRLFVMYWPYYTAQFFIILGAYVDVQKKLRK